MEPVDIQPPPSDLEFYRWLSGISVGVLLFIFWWVGNRFVKSMDAAREMMSELHTEVTVQKTTIVVYGKQLEKHEEKLIVLEEKVNNRGYAGDWNR
jgi:hypothetical protein